MPYIAPEGYAEQKDLVGNGQCVTLVKQLAGAPAASLWREGEKVIELIKTAQPIAEGTAIATFVNGGYSNLQHGNHAAIFVCALAGGIEVFDQWVGHRPRKRILRFGLPETAGVAQRPELYSVVL